MDLVFLGPPACGKGTQAHILRDQHNFYHISSGELLREAAKKEDDLSRQINGLLNNGNLVNSDIVVSLVKKAIDDNAAKNFLFDGFPRNVEQAKILDDYLKLMQREINKVFYFVIDEESLIMRMRGRYSCVKCGALYHKEHRSPKKDGVCDNCEGTDFLYRKDDNLEVLSKRIQVYLQETKPVCSYYQERGVLIEIDARDSVEAVSRNITNNLLAKSF